MEWPAHLPIVGGGGVSFGNLKIRNIEEGSPG